MWETQLVDDVSVLAAEVHVLCDAAVVLALTSPGYEETFHQVALKYPALLAKAAADDLVAAAGLAQVGCRRRPLQVLGRAALEASAAAYWMVDPLPDQHVAVDRALSLAHREHQHAVRRGDALAKQGVALREDEQRTRRLSAWMHEAGVTPKPVPGWGALVGEVLEGPQVGAYFGNFVYGGMYSALAHGALFDIAQEAGSPVGQEEVGFALGLPVLALQRVVVRLYELVDALGGPSAPPELREVCVARWFSDRVAQEMGRS